MRSARGPLIVANLAVAAAMAATYGPDFGGGRHHDIVYVALVLAALAMVRLWRHRRFTTLVLASTGAWSMLTGVLLIYVTWRLPHGRWMTLWHGATSVAFALAFLAHWVRNNSRLLGLARQLAQRPIAAGALTLAWVAIFIAAIATAMPDARAAFRESTADDWADASFILAAAVGAIALVVARTPRARSLLARTRTRNRARGALDVSLLISMWLATLTGLALLYVGRPLRANDAYWLTTAWHIALSVLLLALIVGHAVFNARPLASHAR